MFFSFVILAFSFVALPTPSLVAADFAQDVGALSICAQACLTTGFSTCACGIGDLSCGCRCPNVSSIITTCMDAACMAANIRPATDIWNSNCALAIPSSSSIRPSSKSTSLSTIPWSSSTIPWPSSTIPLSSPTNPRSSSTSSVFTISNIYSQPTQSAPKSPTIASSRDTLTTDITVGNTLRPSASSRPSITTSKTFSLSCAAPTWTSFPNSTNFTRTNGSYIPVCKPLEVSLGGGDALSISALAVLIVMFTAMFAMNALEG